MIDSPNLKIKGVPVHRIYIDQGMVGTSRPGYHFFAAYTPYGIQKLESKFAQRIQAWARGEGYPEYGYHRVNGHLERKVDYVYRDKFEKLLKEIKTNKHLHRIIKQNLVQNLRMYRKGMNENIHTQR